MERAARRFARWVLIGHVALFGLVLLVIAVSVRVLYHGAREQAIEQALRGQELVARQTAQAIQSYYESITGVLDLLHPDQQPATAPRNQPAAARAALIERLLEEGLFTRVAPAIWRTLENKVALLLLVDPRGEAVVVKVLGAADDAPEPRDVVVRIGDWLTQTQRTSISRFLDFPDGGAHALCVPLRGPSGLSMVAVLPTSAIEQTLLRAIKPAAGSASLLIDSDGIILFDPDRENIGRMLFDRPDDPATHLARVHMSRGVGGSQVIEEHPLDDGKPFDPLIGTIEFADVFGQRWALILATPLSEVESLVRPVFRDAMIWGGFLMFALTAVLTSTAFQLIRSRLRLERIQHELLTKELTQARRIQLAWLPDNDDDPPHIDMSAVNVPATHISGDFYNWFELDDGRTAVVIGDVSGHGIAAAFLMATTQLLVRATLPRCGDPGRCLEEVNRQLCQNDFNGQFVTMLILIIDVHRGRVEAATAGHPPPLVGQGAAFEVLEVNAQLVLGVDPDTRYRTQRFDLARGSAMLLYTDGVLDVQDRQGQRFNLERIVQSVYGRYEQAHDMIDAVLAAVDVFREERDLPDDLTLVAIQMQPAAAPRRPALVAGAR